ncbi:MAG: hypothetical protein ACFFHV_05250 [Promethearchaeota archaeon]
MNFPTPKLNEFFNSSKPISGILSVFGDFGVGKTTLALQIAMKTAKEGPIVFIYSKPNFPYEKVSKILNEKSSHILNNIIFICALNFADLCTLVFNLELLTLTFLKEIKTPIRLIVIDSITDLYRLELNRDKKEKNFSLNYQLNQILAILYNINDTYRTEILIVNEISRKNYGDTTKEVQSGGNVVDYWIKSSIQIRRTKKLNVRKLSLIKDSEIKSFNFLLDLSEYGFK